MDLFINSILDDYLYWHGKLLQWLTFGSDERKTGTYTMKAFFQKIGELLNKKLDNKCITTIQVIALPWLISFLIGIHTRY